MIIAVGIGRGGSKGFPSKNSYLLSGAYPLMSYSIRAAKNCRLVDEVYFSTESEELKNIAFYYGAKIIHRPKRLATDAALAEDVFAHACNYLKIKYQNNIEFFVLLFANAPCVTPLVMREMIEELRNRQDADSICTVSKYNMFSPYRARKIQEKGEGGYLVPFCDGVVEEATCDRNSGTDAWFYDCSCAVVRPRCLENIERGMPPQRWLGQKILPYKQALPALDVDFRWQLGQVECWLREYSSNYL